MKKYILFFIICISSFMIYTNNVKALSYDVVNTNNINAFDFQNLTLNSSANYGGYYIKDLSMPNTQNNAFIRYTLDNDINTNNYYLLSLPFKIISVSNNNNYYCSSYTDDDTNIAGTITYGDGTWSTVDLDNTGSGQICTGSYVNEKEILSIGGFIQNSSNSYSQCYVRGVDNSYYLECPIPQNFNNIHRITITVNKNNIDSRFKFYFGQSLAFSISDSSTLNSINNNTNEIKNDIKSDNTSGAENSADDLKNNSAFQDNTGLSGVISMPLTFVNSLTNTCQPINLNIPYMDVDVTIPCMQSVITDKMPLLANLIKIIVNGFIVYRILLDIFQIVRNAKNPEDDRIEVLDL